MITIVGLGRSRGDLTENGKKAIKAADNVFVRTLKSEAGKQVKTATPVSMDDLYESCADFDALNCAIADRILSADSVAANIVYCVDGDGYADASVIALRRKADNGRLAWIAGVSDTLPNEPGFGVQTYAAQELQERPFWPDTSLSVVIGGLSDRLIAGDVKLWLLRFYGGGETVYFNGTGGCLAVPLFELDRQTQYGYNSYVFIPPQKDFEKQRYGYADLMRIMTRLIAPDGCPWDREQTHASIAKNATEEAAELVEAIRLGDIDNMEEESGDVVLQGIFHGFIGERFGEFTADDVMSRLCNKLVSRHTHVFGGDRAANADDALKFWKAAKQKEKE